MKKALVTLISTSMVIFGLLSIPIQAMEEINLENEPMENIQKGDSMEINIGISKENRQKVAQMLNKLLSDEFLLYIKTLNYHWNVKSHHFNDLHAFFKNQYEQLLEISDDVAERVRALDETAFGTMQEFVKNTQLSEKSGEQLSDQQMIQNLLVDHEAIIRKIRKDQQEATDLGDMGTNNFLLNLLEKQEKMAWMLRASIVK